MEIAKQVAEPIYRETLADKIEREGVLGYLYSFPAVFILLVFLAYPFFFGLWLAVTDARIGVPGQWVGLSNFTALLEDSIFRRTVINSFGYTFAANSVKLVIGMLVALLLNQKFRLQRLVRAAVLLPWINPTVLSVIAWLWMFDATFSVINWVLKNTLGISGPIWLGQGLWPMVSVVIVNIWRGAPFYAISFLAAMQTVSQDYYEAAAIDGANAWQKFWLITLPLIKPVVLVVLLLSTIWTFADFQLVWVLTRGGPANSTHLFATYAYQTGLISTLIGRGAAIALFMLPPLVVISALTLWMVRASSER